MPISSIELIDRFIKCLCLIITNLIDLIVCKIYKPIPNHTTKHKIMEKLIPIISEIQVPIQFNQKEIIRRSDVNL